MLILTAYKLCDGGHRTVWYSSISSQPPCLDAAIKSSVGLAPQPVSACRHDGHGVDLHREPLWTWLPAGIQHEAYPRDVLGSSLYFCVGDLAHG